MKFFDFPKFFGLLLLVFAIGFVSCEDDDADDMVIANNDQTIAAYISNDANFSILNDAIAQAGLTSVFTDEDAELTLFAPNNAAFAAANIDLNTISTEDLRRVLMYHVITDDKIKGTDLTFEDRYFQTAATMNGRNLSVMLDRDNDRLMVNEFTAISDSENDFENGVIYELGNVLMPASVVDIVSFDSELSMLATAVTNASLLGAVTDANVTVFAPKNEAFEDVDTGNLTAEQLRSVLTYHVVPQLLLKDDFEDDQVITAANGKTFTIDIDLGFLEIEDESGADTRIEIEDINATDGVIHIIKDVLMPADL
ncbi:MAG: fasciclin domain-containing protein [Bacteroidota bacterium]